MTKIKKIETKISKPENNQNASMSRQKKSALITLAAILFSFAIGMIIILSTGNSIIDY